MNPDAYNIIAVVLSAIAVAWTIFWSLWSRREKPYIWFEDNRFTRPENPMRFTDPSSVLIQGESIAILRPSIACDGDSDSENVTFISGSRGHVIVLNYSDMDLHADANELFAKDRPIISLHEFKNKGCDLVSLGVYKAKVVGNTKTKILHPDQRHSPVIDADFRSNESIKLLFGFFFTEDDRNEFIGTGNWASFIDERAASMPDNIFGKKLPYKAEQFKEITIYLKVQTAKGKERRQRITVKIENDRYTRNYPK